MNAAEFNAIYDRTIVQPLVGGGFSLHETNLFFVENSGVLALIRHRDKWSNLTQSIFLTVCIRHRFLRNLDKQPCDPFSKTISDYPFKIQPAIISLEHLKSCWHYSPYNLGRWPQEKIEFGEEVNVEPKLESIRNSILSSGSQWLKFLQPAEALKQISQHGESAYCEKFWLEDYRNFIEGQ